MEKKYPYEKKPAFFPSTSVEVFFEAESVTHDLFDSVEVDAELDAELDALLNG